MASTLHERFESFVRTPKHPVDNEGTLHRRTVDACQTTRNCPGIFARMYQSVMRRVEACIETHGGHFDHLHYKCTLSAITHKLILATDSVANNP
jgi:hypothetical protein